MVFKRGNRWWYEFTYKGRRIRGSAQTTNKTRALRVEAERRLRCGESLIARPQRFGHFLSQTYLVWSASQNKQQTHRRYAVSAKPLVAFFGSEKLDEITNQQIEQFKLWRLKQCTAAGVNRDLAALRFMFNWAVRNGFLWASPFKVKLLPEGPGKMRIVSSGEEALYFQHANPLLQDVARLILETGMRPGEIFALKGEHVGDDFVLVAEGKTRYARRTIPLTPRGREILHRRKGSSGGYLFPHRIKQAPMVCVRSHKRLVTKLKLDFRLYDFRHTFGSRAAMAGVDLATLKELMGHSSITTTMRYVHPTPEHKKEAMEKVVRYNGGTPKITPSRYNEVRKSLRPR